MGIVFFDVTMHHVWLIANQIIVRRIEPNAFCFRIGRCSAKDLSKHPHAPFTPIVLNTRPQARALPVCAGNENDQENNSIALAPKAIRLWLSHEVTPNLRRNGL